MVLMQGVAPNPGREAASAADRAPSVRHRGTHCRCSSSSRSSRCFEKYCYSCHGDGKSKGDLAARTSTPTSPPSSTIGLAWQKVADSVLVGAMPPKKKPQPTAEEKKLISDWVMAAFDWFDPTMRRSIRGG